MSKDFKYSGFEWIGEIPIHWEVSKVKFGFERKNSKAHEEDPVILSLTRQGVKIRDISTGEGQIASSYYDYNPVSKNDLLLNPMDLYSGANCTISDVEGVISPAYVNLKSKKGFNPLFYDYYFKIQYWAMAFFAHGKGVSFENRWTLNTETLMNYPILVPPESEQNKIANYLSNRIKKIDNIISTYENIIFKYNEYKRSLVTETLTKSLDNNVEMKDTGIDWIGKIPKHWKINKIKYMCYLKGRVGWHGLTSDEYSDEGAYLVTGTDFKDMHVDWNNCNHISYERYNQDHYIQLKENDLLITKDGTIGKLALVKDIPDKATLNSGIFLVRPLNNYYINNYLYWVLFSDIFVRFFDYIKTGTTISHLYQKTFENFVFPYPDINEQKEIVEYLNKKCGLIDILINGKQKTVDELENYKKSLIFEYVTGKKEVPK